MRFAIGGRASAVPTALRGPSVYATTGVHPSIREVGIYNASQTQFVVGLARATALGTRGAALVPLPIEDPARVAVCTGANVHTADATVVAVPGRQAMIGAAYGSGVVWTFGVNGFGLDALTTSGIVIICPTGAGQLFDFYIEWDE
jgi:hypothetical protein